MTHCKKCGKSITDKIYPNGTCQACYNYYHKGGVDNPLPSKGKIAYDHRGYVYVAEHTNALVLILKRATE